MKRTKTKKPVCHFADISFYLRSGLPAARVTGVEDHPFISSFEARHWINTSAIIRIKYSKSLDAVEEVETLNTIYRKKR